MLIAENITKRFSGVVALDKVCLEIYPGKVNAIIGENGAGKSTLMKILSGVYPDFEGSIKFKGNQVNFSNPKEAQEAGIAIIHQELNLIPYLSIMENIFLGREILNSWGLLDKRKMRSSTKQILDRLKLRLDPDTPIYELKVGQQQVVEIAKALLEESQVIIMDEPTSAISDSEVAVLFDIIKDLKSEHKAIVYISHKLDELFKIADTYTVLRDGKSVTSGHMNEISHDELIHKMIGRDIVIARKKPAVFEKEELLSIDNLSLKNVNNPDQNILKHVSFSLSKGEILGIFGLMGAGRTEMLETIFGLNHKMATGRIVINHQEVNFKSPAEAIKAGIALVPEDRKNNGLIMDLGVKTNLCLTILDQIESFGLLDEKKESKLAKKYISELQIKASSPDQQAKNLSGGNQQKIVIAKWLATHPKILLLDEPTRGIDINAKNEIYKLILQLAEAGLGIIVVSSELPEILAISDRILVMAEGKITAEFKASEASEDLILKAAINTTI